MRIRLVVIDDEVFVRKGILSSINWNSHGIDIAGEAPDGISGMELIRKTKPHIVLTDIRMPHVDGLELIRMIREEFPETNILILSVLEDFQTVREALRLGVLDYVQKLLMTPEALLEAVLKIKDSIAVKLQKSVNAQEDGLVEWLSGKSVESIDGLFEGQSSFLLCKIYLREYDAPPMENDFLLLQEGVCLSDNAILNTSLLAQEKENLFWVMMHQKEGCIIPDDAVRALQFLSNKSREAGYVLSGGLSSCFSEKEQRFAAKEQVDLSLQRRFYKGDGVFVYREFQRINEQGEHFVPNELLKQYLTQLKNDNAEDSRLALERLFPIEADEGFAPEAVRESIYHWLSTVMLFLKESDEHLTNPQEDSSLFEQIRLIETYPELREWCLCLHQIVRCTMRNTIKKTKHRDEIQKAMEYTRDHYQDSIKVKEIAEWVNLSENYFSYLFTKEMGKPFVQYLQEVRIEKAKELLRNGEINWYNVTEKVGFESPKYFTKVFKKYTGVTPMQYAKEKYPLQLF